MSQQYRAPRGTQDILPEEQAYWEFVYRTASRLCAAFNYGRLDTPVFEDASLFTRGVGEVTDIVQKEMYAFEDRGGQGLALRPEGTAPVCRAYIQHGMHVQPQPVRLWYWCPIFRYDRPQAGRYREHHQFGVETIGEADPLVDAEVIELLWRLYEELGLSGLTLNLNSIGDPKCRPGYIQALRGYYQDKLKQVCNECEGRFDRNPLRLLDCKQEGCQPVISGAPPITDYLCQECAQHFDRLRSYLQSVEIPYALNSRLVRGLDYYTRTVFEVQPAEEGAQSSVGGGGRYDGLIEQIGGPPTPGIGFGTGIERIILNLKRQQVSAPEPARIKVFIAFQRDEGRVKAFKLASQLRGRSIAALAATGDRSLKAQMRQADAIGSEYVAILGEREISEGTVTLRRLSDGAQETVLQDELGQRLAG